MVRQNKIIACSLSIGIGILGFLMPQAALANEYDDMAVKFNPEANYEKDRKGVTWFYRDLDDGNIEIYGTNCAKSYIEIPEKIHGKTVTKIDGILINDGIKGEAEKITKIKVPQTVISIESAAFLNLMNLREIDMPGNIGIDENAFFSCPNVRINGMIDSNNFNLTTDEGFKFGWNTLNGKSYFIKNELNEFRTGWFNYEGRRYYCYSNGEMAKDTNIDGYYINSNGVLEN